jgi:glutathionylspermidine synthase
MLRVTTPPRAGWQRKVEELGLVWHDGDGAGGRPYWDEAAHYRFTAEQVDELEAATNELHRLALGAVQRVIDRRLYDRLAIPPLAVPLIEHSWRRRPPSLYGRFDLAYDGASPPKLLEYNADTPTALLEAAVVQWFWLEECHPGSDQFNSLHERLIDQWRQLKPGLRSDTVHFCSVQSADNPEDEMTAEYLRDTAQQAGLLTAALPIDQIGWDHDRAAFVGLREEPIATLFKLYPWEWLVREPFAVHLEATEEQTRWIEPAWKMVLSNKGILPLLWELNPGHPNLLPAYFDAPHGLVDWISKPLLGREGANLEMRLAGRTLTTGGTYHGVEGGGLVFQQAVELPCFDGRYPVLGCWMVGDEAAGLGIREGSSPLLTNASSFVPHLFE